MDDDNIMDRVWIPLCTAEITHKHESSHEKVVPP